MYSQKGIQKLTDDMADIQKTIAMHERALNPETKGLTDYALADDAIARKRKELIDTQAKLQQIENLQNFYNTSFIKFPKADRTIDNQAYDNWFSDSAYQGLLRTGQWAGGAVELVGDAYAKAKRELPKIVDPYYKANPCASLRRLPATKILFNAEVPPNKPDNSSCSAKLSKVPVPIASAISFLPSGC